MQELGRLPGDTSLLGKGGKHHRGDLANRNRQRASWRRNIIPNSWIPWEPGKEVYDIKVVQYHEKAAFPAVWSVRALHCTPAAGLCYSCVCSLPPSETQDAVRCKALEAKVVHCRLSFYFCVWLAAEPHRLHAAATPTSQISPGRDAHCHRIVVQRKRYSCTG
jgi:hypothetical protein